MTSKWRQFEKKPASSTNNNSEPTEEDLKPTYVRFYTLLEI